MTTTDSPTLKPLVNDGDHIRGPADAPVKISELAKLLRASESHLGKVMHRLALAKVVSSRRGPNGGFVIGQRAAEMTLLDLYEMFNGPISDESCLLGYPTCPFGTCVLGDAIAQTNERLKEVLSARRLVELNSKMNLGQ